jgi:hypothetical protein
MSWPWHGPAPHIWSLCRRRLISTPTWPTSALQQPSELLPGLSTIIKVESSDTEMDSDFLGHSDIKTKRKMALSRDLTRLCRSVLVEWLNQNAELSLSSVELFVYQTIIWQCLMMCRFRTTFELCHSSELLYEIEILWVPYSTSFGFALVPCFTSAGIEFFLVI